MSKIFNKKIKNSMGDGVLSIEGSSQNDPNGFTLFDFNICFDTDRTSLTKKEIEQLSILQKFFNECVDILSKPIVITEPKKKIVKKAKAKKS